ncbi:MAG: T9SS type A sorting domain-containing protein, partial [Candidatus Cloacimonetes bacterium]|nr:T9SS type A sorting domain-containing protein [Candidatus Cloacimonadota bacterium]
GAGRSPATAISFSIPNNSYIELSIFNIKGQKVKTLVNKVLPAGAHSVTWNGRDSNGKRVSSGIYFYKFKAGDFQKVRKMVLIK